MSNEGAILKKKSEPKVGAMRTVVIDRRKTLEAWLPTLDGIPALWRKHHCLTQEEALEEADRIRHVLAGMKPTPAVTTFPKGITHWSELLPERTFKRVMYAMRQNPATLTAEEARKLMRKTKIRRSLLEDLTKSGKLALTNALGAEIWGETT